jgi:hypothetical protein
LVRQSDAARASYLKQVYGIGAWNLLQTLVKRLRNAEAD